MIEEKELCKTFGRDRILLNQDDAKELIEILKTMIENKNAFITIDINQVMENVYNIPINAKYYYSNTKELGGDKHE